MPPPPDGYGYGYRHRKRFSEVLTEAVADFAEHGYDSAERLEHWLALLRQAAEAELLPFQEAQRRIRAGLTAIFDKLRKTGAIKAHPGLGEFSVRNLSARTRAMLDQRIFASAELIRLNREQAIETTLRRASGYLTAIPPGGGKSGDKREEKARIAKPIQQQSYIERRVTIDQGHKLVANINQAIAEDNDAIAAKWRHVHQAGYDGRPEHEARDGKIYVMRGNWAMREGLMKLAGREYVDAIEAPGTAVFCRCWFEYIYHLRDLYAEAPDMVTDKGLATISVKAAA